jgi:hypothetical protein
MYFENIVTTELKLGIMIYNSMTHFYTKKSWL